MAIHTDPTLQSPDAPTASDVDGLVREMAARARQAARRLALAPTAAKNSALNGMAQAFRRHQSSLLEANRLDLEAARQAGLGGAMIDRLDLGRERIEAMAAAVEQVAVLDDPVGEILDVRTRPNGLRVGRMRAPIGVIAVIYESRPNVTADAGCLCIKSGNAVILRGGSEAFHSNGAIARLMAAAAQEAGLPDGCVQFIPTTDRAAVPALARCDDYVDLIIPRGGRSLIESIVNQSRVPVIKHLDGNCYIFVDESADVDEAVRIILNAKTQRPAVCNALESLLVHEAVAPRLLPKLLPALLDQGVELRADEAVRRMSPTPLKPATEEDWRTEYLDLILTVGLTPSLQAAIDFINVHSSHHTDAILTRDHGNAIAFLSAVDSACVFVNASTRLADGGEFGLGCEIGISTDKLHARGPMGLADLTTLKYIALGAGQLRR